MPKINLKKHVWHKYAISGGVLAGITAITLGAMYGYSKTSNEKLGRKNFTDEAELKNIFIGRNAKPKSYFLEVHNNKHKVDYDPLSEVVTDGKTRLTTTEYLDKYYAKHHALPYLNIKYGSFNFYNQYIEAVSPIEFYKFTEWFMKNVSWGPEIITLKSFSIVKGVEMAGNNITLGSHSNKNKEYTTIKFFPDAFFGTLPIYSSLSGRGNAQDSLTYKLNKSVLSEPELRKFLANIGKYNALANISNKTINEQFFRGITNVRYLKNQKVYALRRPDWEKRVLKVTYSDVERNRLVQKSPYLLIVAANSLAEAKEKFATKLKEYKDKDSLKLLEGFSAENVNFEEKIIANAEIKTNNYNNTNEIVDKALLIHFDDGSSYTIHNAFGEVLNSSTGQNGEKSFKNLNKYIQFDKALKTVKNLIEDLTSRFIEQIRTKFQPNKFSEETLKNSLAKFSELNGLYREWLALRQIIENMETDLRNYVGAKKVVEDSEKLQKEIDEKLKTAMNGDKANLEAQKKKATADKTRAESVINVNIFKTTLQKRIEDRKSLIKTLEDVISKLKEAIKKAESDPKLKHTLEKELKSTEFTLKNAKLLNDDDTKLRETLKDVNHTTNSGNGNNSTNPEGQEKFLESLTKVIEDNKKRASALLDKVKKSGKITELTSKLSSQFGIKTDEIETLNALVAMYDSFTNDPNIDKLQAESFSSKNSDEKVKLLKQVDKTVFETNQRLNRLVTGTNPTEQFVEKDYFAVDIAYLPNELISIESLVYANTKAKLNWRDFYNLDEFVKDRKNILPDAATEFFAYSKFVNDQKKELSKKNAHLGADFDYAKISDKRESVKKDLEKVDAEIAKFDNKVESVKKLVAPYFENKDLFPDEFSLLYSKVLDPKTNKKNFDEFWSSNADVVLEYLTKALGDENGTNDEEGKTINGFIKKHSQAEFTELTQLFAESSKLIEKINSGKSTDDDKLKAIELGKKIRDTRDKIDENDDHIKNKVARVINAKIDFQKAITLVKELKKDISEYKKNIAKRYSSTFLMQLSDYQLRFLSSQNIKENSELANAYKKLISSFNNSSANLNKKVEEYINLVEENKKQIARTLSHKDYAGWYSWLKHGDEAAIEKKLKETQTTIIKRQVRENSFKTKWEKISSKPLVDALKNHKLDDSKTLTDTLKSHADRVLALIREFFEKASDKSQSVYDQLKKKYADDLKKIEDSLKSKKSEKASLSDKSESVAKITKLNQEIDKLFAESVVIAEQLEQLKFFKNWHKTGFNELNDIKKKIDSNSLPALHLLIPFNKLEAELSVFLNDKDSVLETNLFKELNRLKKVLGEINSEIRIKIRPMVHNEAKTYFEAYESYLTYKTELDGLKADKDLLEQGNKYLMELKRNKKPPEYAHFYNDLYKKFEEDSRKNEASLLGSLSLKDDLLSIFESKAISEKANVATFKKDLSNFTNALAKDIMHDEVVARATTYLNDFKKSNSTLASEMKKIKESENSSELGKDLKTFNETITGAYEKEAETFVKTFKENIIVEQYKVLFRELKASKTNEDNESEGNKKVPEFLKKFEKADNGASSVRDITSRLRRSLSLPSSIGTSAINSEVLFNSFVKRMTEVEKHIDKSVEEFGEYLGSLGEYFDTLIAPALRDHKLYEAYNHSLEHSAKIVENIRKTQLLKEARELDKNVQARQITNENDVIIAKSKIELIDILTKKNILKPNATKEEIDKLIFKADISDIKKNGSSLEVTIKNVDPENAFGSQTKFGSKFVKFSVDANADKNIIKNMNEFFSVLGYKKMVAPSVIKEENEVSNPETGKSERSYDVFADAYEGLTDELLKEVPYAGEWLEGLHIKKSINSDGVMEYSLENGKYLGFTKNIRVGLWAILKMSDPNFKGISTDFLKFVGAHEYGHHITLNGAHDLSNKGSDPIFVSALTPNATPNINNYYSKDAVELYLKARTHVELGTKRLLDEFGALKDYGEYAEFRFAKKGKDGKITFDDKPEDAIKSMEKESDIWGVGLEDRDLWKALSNKNRRFLQDFAGMLEAVKNRRKQNGLKGADEKWLSPFDMWVINAIDYYSGTLNPTVNSAFSNAAKVKYMVKNDKGEYEFKEASLSMLKGIIKDGQGKLIEFEEVNKNGSKVIEPKVVEGVKDAEGNYVIIHKVLMHNADGSPVLSVPLNVNLTDTKSPYYDKNAVKFVNDKINTIVKTIKSLIVDRFNINGWNTSDTRLSLDPTILIDYPETRNIFGARLPSTVTNMFSNIYKNYLANRDPDQGYYKKGKDGQIPFIKYYNKDGSENTSSNFPKAIPSNLIYGNPKYYINRNNSSALHAANETSSDIKLGHVLSILFNSGNSLNNNINGGAGQVLWIDKDAMYMPNVKLETAFTDPFFAQTLPRDYLQVFNSKKIIKWLSKYTPTFITSSTNPNGVWNMFNSSGQIITFPNTSEADFTQVSKLKMNYTESLKRLDHNVLTGLFNSFASEVMKDNSIEFEDYKKWLEFVNVDLTKAKYDKNSDTVNWTVDYVKSKIDIEKFKKAYRTEIIDKLSTMTEMSEEEKNVFREFYKKASADSSNQMWANDIMRRFSSSLFAMFNSALTFDKLKNSNRDAMWIFDQKHGYGEFKKQEFKIDGADRKKWEIGAEDTIKTYEKLAKEFGVDLKAITLVDSLVFDGKIQLYTDQTIVHVTLQQFELVNIFTSLANAAFHTGPSNDVKNYFINKTERKFNELFSDYTYNFAEVINRDNLQITYSPSNHDFGNMPSFLSNISESNTGLEYVVDGTTTAKWKSKALKLNDRGGRNGITNAILDYERLADNEEKYKADALNLRYKKAVLSEDKNLSDDSNYNNSYFGEFQSINNGWFKDRWYRDFLGFKLYDDKGKEIVDDTIRIKDLEGKVVNTRARAYWQYYIQSQGVGKRNISGIWRDGSKDAVAMFGYLSSDIADKANYIAFKDKKTGEVKTLKITKDNTSNMFYYKTQNIENEKKHDEAKSDEERSKIRHTLADEQYDYSDANGKHKGKGFVSWVSDYGIMSKYRNALLLPGHTYSVYFSSDEQGTKDILYADLGQWESIAENGKTFSQASIRMAKSEKPYKIDENGNKVYEHILYVYDQFNGVK